MSRFETQIASHRGGAALWPENSERAFRGTLTLGVEQIEFDVQLSTDGVPVIFHDATLDRVTDGTGPVGSRTLAELKALSLFRDGGRILTLAEGADILAPADIALRCEIKPGIDMAPYPGLVTATLAELASRDLLPRTVVTSFHLPTLDDVIGRAPPIRGVIWLVADPIARLLSPRQLARLAQDSGIAEVSLNHRTLREAGRLAALRAEGLQVGAFAVLENQDISWALDQRLTVFTTDRPDAAVSFRAEIRTPADPD